MAMIRKRFEPGLLVVILVTLVLFVTAIFVKGIGHDLLLEAGVFLISAKLILMAYKDSVAMEDLTGRFEEVRSMLLRLESRIELESGLPPRNDAGADRRDPGREPLDG